MGINCLEEEAAKGLFDPHLLHDLSKKLKNKKYLMVHGTADDNVHYQQSMMFSRALEEEDVLFRQISYPDEAHGLVGLRPHFYHTLTDFLINDCFQRNEVIQG